MHGILYEEANIWQFIFITVLLGGGAAWLTGKATAKTWRPFSAQYYIVDTIILMIIGAVAYQYTHTNQMVTQYHWLYDRSSPLGWKEKS